MKKDKIHQESYELALSIIGRGYAIDEAKNAVTEYRKGKGLSVNQAMIDNIISKANGEFNNEYSKEKGEVIGLHLERYNRDILSLIEARNIIEEDRNAQLEGKLYDEDGNYLFEYDYWKEREKMIAIYYQALSSMSGKERVLQMYSKGFQILISNIVNVNYEPKKSLYDLSKLNNLEKIDFLNLLLKARKNDYEMGAVILRGSVEENQQVEDVEAEVIEESPNVNKIKIEESKQLPAPQNQNALQETKDKLAEALKKAAIKQLKNAGSKTVYEDERAMQEVPKGQKNSK